MVLAKTGMNRQEIDQGGIGSSDRAKNWLREDRCNARDAMRSPVVNHEKDRREREIGFEGVKFNLPTMLFPG